MIEEVPEAAVSTVGVLAKCSLSHSERDVQRLGKVYNLTLPIELTPVQISKDVEIPVLLPSSWLKFMMSLNLWHTFSGLDAPDDSRCEAQWSAFWTNFRKIMPNHQVFRMADDGVLSLRRTAAFVVHGDEGRTKKKQQS